MSSKVISVLGMHRSGTSCLAGLLDQVGVFLGNVSKKNPYNLKGNHENYRIMALHEELLRVNLGSWDKPPEAVIWSQELKDCRDEIIRSYEGNVCWGFKDPRTLFTLEGWMEVLSNLQLVGTYRHPFLVAKSLQRRNGFPIEKGLQLWVTYNEKLLSYYKKHEFPIISFDFEPFKDKSAQLIKALCLPSVDTTLDFFDPELRHTLSCEDEPLQDQISQLYLTLNEIAL